MFPTRVALVHTAAMDPRPHSNKDGSYDALLSQQSKKRVERGISLLEKLLSIPISCNSNPLYSWVSDPELTLNWCTFILSTCPSEQPAKASSILPPMFKNRPIIV